MGKPLNVRSHTQQGANNLQVSQAYQLKSAEAVAALLMSGLSLACQTAPLCPIKVPIQSPVWPWRNMGLPSEQGG